MENERKETRRTFAEAASRAEAATFTTSGGGVAIDDNEVLGCSRYCVVKGLLFFLGFLNSLGFHSKKL